MVNFERYKKKKKGRGNWGTNLCRGKRESLKGLRKVYGENEIGNGLRVEECYI